MKLYPLSWLRVLLIRSDCCMLISAGMYRYVLYRHTMEYVQSYKYPLFSGTEDVLYQVMDL